MAALRESEAAAAIDRRDGRFASALRVKNAAEAKRRNEVHHKSSGGREKGEGLYKGLLLGLRVPLSAEGGGPCAAIPPVMRSWREALLTEAEVAVIRGDPVLAYRKLGAYLAYGKGDRDLAYWRLVPLDKRLEVARARWKLAAAIGDEKLTYRAMNELILACELLAGMIEARNWRLPVFDSEVILGLSFGQHQRDFRLDMLLRVREAWREAFVEARGELESRVAIPPFGTGIRLESPREKRLHGPASAPASANAKGFPGGSGHGDFGKRQPAKARTEQKEIGGDSVKGGRRPAGASPARPESSPAWPYLALGFAGSAAVGAVGMWLLLRRRTV